MADWIGKTLGRVRIESMIARGGMAEVYLGTHTTLQRDVAVKLLRNHFEDDLRPRERFEMEAQAVARLRHPNIVQVFDFDTIEDQPYIVMEYIRGPSLSKYLSVLHENNRRLELPVVSRLLTGVANALQYAHESGVVHRDVKPGNILLTSRSLQIVPGETIPLDFEPVLTDFGLVRFLDSSRKTTTGLTAGTPAYMSPEQAMGLATDGRTDIYSLGIVLYEMLSGKVPFDGDTTMSVLLKHLNEAPAPIPGLSPALQRVLDIALAKVADDRFQEPKEMAAAFNTALKETSDASTALPVPRVSKSAKVKKPAPSGLQRYWKPVALAGLLIALAGTSLLLNGMGIPVTATTETPRTVALSDTPTQLVPIALGPTGVLQFQDGDAVLDQVTLIAQAMPAAPAGSNYQVWLVNGGERLPLGTLAVDGEGRGNLPFDDPEDRNLLASYEGVEITIEPIDSANLNGLEPRLAYAYSLPDSGLAYLRGLMVSFPSTPEQIGLIHGLAANIQMIDQAAKEMLSNYEAGDQAGARENAEAILNLLVGDKSENHKDWSGDGQLSDPGDGYGLLLNGNNFGYIQAVYSNTDYAVNAAGASRNMIVNGDHVKTCVQNLAGWAPELRNHMLTILQAAILSDVDQPIRRSAVLAEQMLNGIDLNENEQADPISNECGLSGAYKYTYQMADMPLLPVNAADTPTSLTESVTPSPMGTPPVFIVASPTLTGRPGDSPTNPPSIPPTNPPSNPPTEPPSNPPTNPPPPQPQPTDIPDKSRECNDGIDNDGDGLTDGDDPDCRNRGDDDESG